MDGMHDQSEVFRHMAKSAKLLGSTIYKIQEVWKGPDEPTMPWGLYQKASSSSKQYPHQSPQRLWDLWAYMTQMPFTASMAWPTALGVGRITRMREQLLTTCGQCTTGLAWCVTNVTTTCQLHQTLSATTASRTVHPPERETPMSQLHQSNCQQGTGRINLS